MLRQFALDIPALLRPLGALLVALLVFYFVVRYSNQSVSQATQRRDAQQRALSEARARVHKSGEERDMIQKYLPTYYQLEKEGIVGQERRLDWIEGLRVANNHADLYGVQYEIGVQQPYAKKDALGAPNLDIRSSIMKLRFGLLHEEDLSRFLGAISAQGLGTFIVNQCSLTRIRKLDKPVNQPTLQADCELSWITLAPATKKEGQP